MAGMTVYDMEGSLWLPPRSFGNCLEKPWKCCSRHPSAISRGMKQISLEAHPGPAPLLRLFLTKQAWLLEPTQFSDKQQPQMGQAGGCDKGWDKVWTSNQTDQGLLALLHNAVGPVQWEKLREKRNRFPECSLCCLCAGGFTYIFSFNPHKQPCEFNAAKPDTEKELRW